ncbi:MAG: hypothetical protein ABSB70_01345 [Candidatus Velthaea sp.]
MSIDWIGEEGFVTEVHTHDVIVRVCVPGGHDERSYAHESLRLVPATAAPSHLYAH